jgi:uncharacterized membrane protein YdbT with pleckstrin-like domain
MSYTEDSLSDGEEIVEIFKQHWTVTIMPWVLLVLSIGLAFPITIVMWLTIRGREYSLTNKRVIRKTGIIARNTDEMNLGAVENVEMKQSMWQRIFGSGHIIVTGRGSSAMGYRNVDGPLKVKKAIENAMSASSRQ